MAHFGAPWCRLSCVRVSACLRRKHQPGRPRRPLRSLSRSRDHGSPKGRPHPLRESSLAPSCGGSYDARLTEASLPSPVPAQASRSRQACARQLALDPHSATAPMVPRRCDDLIIAQSMGNLQYVPRFAARLLERALLASPVVVLMGARQVGKSTLVRSEPFMGDRLYLTLDELEVPERARMPRDDLVRAGPRLTLDEVQRKPDLLLAVKRSVDEDRPRRNGRFVLTGSANLLRMHRVSESLAGRATYVNLWPLTRRERQGLGTTGIRVQGSEGEVRLEEPDPRGAGADGCVHGPVRSGVGAPCDFRLTAGQVLGGIDLPHRSRSGCQTDNRLGDVIGGCQGRGGREERQTAKAAVVRRLAPARPSAKSRVLAVSVDHRGVRARRSPSPACDEMALWTGPDR